MSDVLARICADKRAHVAARKRAVPPAALEACARSAPPVRGFAAALAGACRQGFGLIAEIKRASPSAGPIRPGASPAAIARAYRRGGAACLSVLTDEPWFQGRDSDLTEARSEVNLPFLRKDFMLDPYQVVEARAIHADAILIVMAAVCDALAAELAACAADHGMDVLAEVHDRAELDRALALNAALIGINNRNLKTLVTDTAIAETLAPHIPSDRDIVCESGLTGHGDLLRMARCGVRRFLVGEHLMRQADIEAATRALLGRGGAAA